jgi:hypothetical protein
MKLFFNFFEFYFIFYVSLQKEQVEEELIQVVHF